MVCILCMPLDAFAQRLRVGERSSGMRISHTYNNVSLSEALFQLNNEQTEYVINFLYNELEDFRITATIKNKKLPDAIQQMIGFYPLRMTVKPDDHEIYVECTHKTDRHLTGTIIDEQGQPVAYANVAILNPTDSTLLSGGVSNESGYFALPYEQPIVLARISYVGYKTVYKICEQPEVGTIQMQPDNYTLKGVTVKGQRLLYTSTDRGLLVSIQGTPLEQFGSVSEMLSHMPLMMSNGEIAGHGKPEIYINNKKVRDPQELYRIRADEIMSAEIITNPGVEYGAEVTSVIRLKTVRRQGEGWSGNFSTAYRQGKEHYANLNAALNYRLRNGMDFFVRGYLTDNNTLINANANDQLQASSTWDYQKSDTWRNRSKYYFADLGWNWEISEKYSLGLTYTANSFIGNAEMRITSDEVVQRDGVTIDEDSNLTLTKLHPRLSHAVNAYYVGELGKWQLNFSADYYGDHSDKDMEGGTIGAATISSETRTKNRLFAEKLVVIAPVPKGSFTFGEEASDVNRTSDFTQNGFSADNNVHQKTQMWSLFADYALKTGKLSLNAGLRWQHEYNDYETNGRKDGEQSPDYHVLIPRASLSYQGEVWKHSLAYQCSRRNPSYNLLSSAVNYRSKYEYDTGNPYLRPQTTRKLAWTSQWRWLYMQAFYTYFKNPYTSFQTAYDDINHPGVMIMDYRNLPKMENYGIMFNLSPKVGIWQTDYMICFGFSKQDLEPIGITHAWNDLICQFDFDNTFTLPHDWLLNIEADLTPYHRTGPSKRKATGGINLRLNRQFLKDKSLNVALSVKDILHTRYTEMTAYCGINIRTQFRQHNDTRRIGIDLSWKFNATKSRYKGSHAGQSERNRL